MLDGARLMLAAALEAEVDAYIAELAEHLDEGGRRLVVRNSHAEARTITTAAGRLEVRASRVNDRRVDDSTGERCRFRSSIQQEDLDGYSERARIEPVLRHLYPDAQRPGQNGPAESP